ncbi:MAG: hypothetical protein K6G29_00415, partial [Clostridiales bacterium]|nr:hypothetical protein [Clostridiales bacterium]
MGQALGWRGLSNIQRILLEKALEKAVQVMKAPGFCPPHIRKQCRRITILNNPFSAALKEYRRSSFTQTSHTIPFTVSPVRNAKSITNAR